MALFAGATLPPPLVFTDHEEPEPGSSWERWASVILRSAQREGGELVSLGYTSPYPAKEYQPSASISPDPAKCEVFLLPVGEDGRYTSLGGNTAVSRYVHSLRLRGFLKGINGNSSATQRVPPNGHLGVRFTILDVDFDYGRVQTAPQEAAVLPTPTPRDIFVKPNSFCSTLTTGSVVEPYAVSHCSGPTDASQYWSAIRQSGDRGTEEDKGDQDNDTQALANTTSMTTEVSNLTLRSIAYVEGDYNHEPVTNGLTGTLTRRPLLNTAPSNYAFRVLYDSRIPLTATKRNIAQTLNLPGIGSPPLPIGSVAVSGGPANYSQPPIDLVYESEFDVNVPVRRWFHYRHQIQSGTATFHYCSRRLLLIVTPSCSQYNWRGDGAATVASGFMVPALTNFEIHQLYADDNNPTADGTDSLHRFDRVKAAETAKRDRPGDDPHSQGRLSEYFRAKKPRVDG